MLESYARGVSSGSGAKMPSKVARSVLVANNRILAAAIIENGGQLVISPNSVDEMFANKGHVVVVPNEDGSLTVTLASKDAILAQPEAMAL